MFLSHIWKMHLYKTGIYKKACKCRTDLKRRNSYELNYFFKTYSSSSTPKIFKYITTKKFGNRASFLVGIISLCGVSAYLSVDSQNRRKVRILAGGLVRFARTLHIGLAISVDYKWNLFNLDEGSEEYRTRLKSCHKRGAERILSGCLKNGGLYLKLGQGLVSLNLILPVEYTSTLVVLQNQALTQRPQIVEQLFLEDFGKKPTEMFAEFEEEPLAAASIAQVHKAKTFDGKSVAVKVQYIDLRDRFYSDMKTCDILMSIVGWIHPNFEFFWMLEDLKETLQQELDFEQEGKHGEQCAKDLSHLDYVYVPKVHWDMTSKRVLTTEFIDGVKVDDIDGIKRLGLNLKDVDHKLVVAFSDQIFLSGFIHADPHPGNILVRQGKKKTGTAEIVLLDHGLYETLNETHRHALCRLFTAIAMKDEAAMKESSIKLGVKNHVLFCEILIQRPMSTLKKDAMKIPSNVTPEERKIMQIAVQKKMDKINAVLKEMPRSLLLVLRNLNTIRSIVSDHGNPVDRYDIMLESCAKGVLRKISSAVVEAFKSFKDSIIG